MYPCRAQAPILYTYYAFASLLVIILAISLVWLPFIQVVAETNSIISNMILFLNNELFGRSNSTLLTGLGNFFGSEEALSLISLTVFFFIMYLASTDILLFAGCYVYNWPDYVVLSWLKRVTLGAIEYLLTLTWKNKLVTFDNHALVRYYDPKSKADGQVGVSYRKPLKSRQYDESDIWKSHERPQYHKRPFLRNFQPLPETRIT